MALTKVKFKNLDADVITNIQTIVAENSSDSAETLALFSGGTGVTYNGTGQFSIGQDVATTASPSFAGLAVAGTVTADGLTSETSDTIPLTLNGGANATFIQYTGGSADDIRIGTVNSKSGFSVYNSTDDRYLLDVTDNGDISFYEDTGTTPKFFWDASAENLGLGTTSPTGDGATLHINGSTANSTLHLTNTTTGSGAADGTYVTTSGNDFLLRNREAGNMLFYTDNAIRMTITSTGNVGIGVTPESWSDGGVNPDFSPLQLGASAALSGTDATSFMSLTSNAYRSSAGWKYINSNSAARYDQNDADHVWYTAALGGADAAISWSERMRITSTGSVGIGTSSPSSKLHLQGSTGGYLELKMEPSADTDVTSIAFRNAADNVTKGYVLYDHTNNYMGFRTNGSGEAMRIDASGMLNAYYGISVDGGTIKLDGNYPVGTGNVALGDAALDDASLSGGYNTAIGWDALTANTSGQINTALGGKALTANTSGSENTALGYAALERNTTASYNTAVGRTSMAFNTTGANNTSIGFGSLYSNTTASHNTAIGYQAAYSTDGNGMGITAIGSQALYANTTGADNVAIGGYSAFTGVLSAMRYNTTGGANVAVGVGAMSQNTTGGSNVAMGRQALYSNTTASYNTAVGYQAGYSYQTGGPITAVGYLAGYSAVSSSETTALGSYALQNNTANSNTGVGHAALLTTTSGGQNVGVGSDAGRNSTTAISNVLVGYHAGFTNTTGSFNTAIGYKALEDHSGLGNSYHTAVGASALENTTTGVRNTALGYAAGANITTGNYNTAVGFQAMLGTASTANGNTAVGYVSMYSITTGANNVAVGYGSLNKNTSGQLNVALGYDALTNNTTANNNTAVGYQAGYSNTTGINMAAFGRNALYSNTSGGDNTSIGDYTLYDNTTGQYNTAVGSSALQNNTTASNNTAVGYQAGYSNTTGADIALFGYQAGYSNTTGIRTTAFGRKALFANTTGNDNSALGHDALVNNTTGASNTAIGRAALLSNTTASNNTAVGYQAGYSNATGIGNVFIGKDAGYYSTGSGNCFIGYYAGNASTGSANTFVGSGLAGSIYAAGEVMTTGSKNTILGNFNGNQGGLDIRTSNNNIVLSDGDGNPRGIFDSSGHLLVALTSITDATSRTYGNAFSGSSAYANWTSWGSGTHTHAAFRNATNQVGTISTNSTSTAYNTTSDYRLKENVVDLTGATDRLKQIPVHRFNFIADPDKTVDGFLAHEVQDIVPEAITGTKDEVDADGNPVYQGIDQSKLVPLLVATIKELEARIAALESA